MRILLTVLVMATSANAGGDAQRRTAESRPGTTVPVAVALKLGADAYNFTGQASCTHAPVAAIYNLRAEQWMVQQSGDSGGVTLTLWHPASGADMFTLSVSAGPSRAAVSTVKVGTNGTVEGSGTVTLTPHGKGGTFTVAATTAKGVKVTGTIKCEAFTAAVAEGGD